MKLSWWPEWRRKGLSSRLFFQMWLQQLRFSENRTVKALGSAFYFTKRFLQGARPTILAADHDDRAGRISAPGIDIIFGGGCPVQGEGTVDGYPCYYRSRGEGWSFEVFPIGTDLESPEAWPPAIYDYAERRYFWPDGGHVASTVSRRCIYKAVQQFRASQKGKAS